jgi:hypothetical protein
MSGVIKLGDGDDKYYNLIQVVNDFAVHALMEYSYNRGLLKVKLDTKSEIGGRKRGQGTLILNHTQRSHKSR